MGGGSSVGRRGGQVGGGGCTVWACSVLRCVRGASWVIWGAPATTPPAACLQYRQEDEDDVRQMEDRGPRTRTRVRAGRRVVYTTLPLPRWPTGGRRKSAPRVHPSTQGRHRHPPHGSWLVAQVAIVPVGHGHGLRLGARLVPRANIHGI
jgi:hypothetical protein